MKKIPFIKMHGCGNDYVYLDGFRHDVPADVPALARRVSDRNRSVGGDGLVLMLPPQSNHAAASMRMFNSDGSEGSLCGNALRCMALWLHQTGRAGREFFLEMGTRLVGVRVVASDSGGRSGVIRVQIGQPVVLNAEQAGRGRFVQRIGLPSLKESSDASYWTESLTLRDDIRHVSMGNPHTILFVESLAATAVAEAGPAIEQHVMFPNRTNVEFVEVIAPSIVNVRVWERGSGETLACGSGACAVAVAGIESGLLTPDSERAIQVNMRGGTLHIVWADDDQVYLEGPAEVSFEGFIIE